MSDRATELTTATGAKPRAARRRDTAPRVWGVMLTIAGGGALGALARYAIGSAWPHGTGGFPWATFAINVIGCFLIGVLMVILAEVSGHPHHLIRPFLGVGVLGGFTTFSAYTVDVDQLVAAGHARLALLYLFGTVGAALVAVQLGVVSTRAARWAARARRKKDADDEA